MKCDRCGEEIRSGEDPLFTTVDEQMRGPGVTGAPTRVHYLWLCPACTRRRRATQRFLWGTLLIAIGVGLVIAIIRAMEGASLI